MIRLPTTNNVQMISVLCILWSYIYILVHLLIVVLTLRSRVAKELDLQLAGCELNSRPGAVE